ncbi:MAG: glycosyltransferase [Candidatus Thiodiazotropha sp.]
MNKLKVIYIIDEYGVGGTERQLELLLRNIDKAKFTPILITLRRSETVVPDDLGCDAYSLNVNKIFGLKGISEIMHGIALVKRLQPDIIQSFFIDSAILAVIIGKALRVKCTITSRRDLGYWYTKKTLFLMKLLNSFTDKILVNSNAIKQNIEEKESVRQDKIQVIHNGIDKILDVETIQHYKRLHKEKLNIDRSVKVVGIVSNLNRNVKRVDIFVRAAIKYLKNNDDTVFLVIGEGHLKDDLIKLAQKEVESNKIRFLGSVNNPIELTCCMDIAVNSSETEGFSNSVIESMAHLACTVASNNPGNAELVKDKKTGWLFDVNDVKGLSDTLSYLLENDEVRARLAESARNEVLEKYSLQSMIKNHENFYMNTVPGKNV